MVKDSKEPLKVRHFAARYFQRGTYRNAYIGAGLTETEMEFNRTLAENYNSLNAILNTLPDNEKGMDELALRLQDWYEAHKAFITQSLQSRKNLCLLLSDAFLSLYEPCDHFRFWNAAQRSK